MCIIGTLDKPYLIALYCREDQVLVTVLGTWGLPVAGVIIMNSD